MSRFGVSSLCRLWLLLAVSSVQPIFFVIWKLMGSQEDYETAYRCGAYLMALVPITAIISAIPYAGVVIIVVIDVFYLVTASISCSYIPSQKSMARIRPS